MESGKGIKRKLEGSAEGSNNVLKKKKKIKATQKSSEVEILQSKIQQCGKDGVWTESATSCKLKKTKNNGRKKHDKNQGLVQNVEIAIDSKNITVNNEENGIKIRDENIRTYKETSGMCKKTGKKAKSDNDKTAKTKSGENDKTLKHSIRHKKMLSKRRKKKLKEKGEVTDNKIKVVSVQRPKNPEEYSSNWKQLLSTLPKTEKKMSKHVKKPAYRSQPKGDNPEKITLSAEKEKQKKPDIWFDDVDEILIDRHKPISEISKTTRKEDPLVKTGSYTGLTKVIAMDCEMVGVGPEGRENMLARVSIVNQYGHCLYDQYVTPMEKVVDYRTRFSGIRKEDLDKGMTFSVVQKEVADMLKNRILVGHAIQNDLKVLYLSHPNKKIRDTSRYKPFRRLFNGRIPSLKKLTAELLKVKVQEGEHDSVQDSQAAMRLYTMYRQQWEKDIKSSFLQLKKGKHKNSHKHNSSNSDSAESD